jgi:hypothetical protein
MIEIFLCKRDAVLQSISNVTAIQDLLIYINQWLFYQSDRPQDLAN